MLAPDPPTPDESRDEVALCRRIAAGEGSAASELIANHADQLYEFVHYRVGGDRQTAEDVVQDTFLTALGKLDEFDGRAALHTWLCGIAKNRIRNERRRSKPRALEDVLAEADPEIDAILADIERTPLPEWVLEKRETRELVGATLGSLPPDYVRALLEKYVEGRSVRDLALELGRGAKATESLLFRARAAFARVFTLLADKRGGLS